MDHYSPDHRAAGESTTQPAARRLESVAGRAAQARALQRLVSRRAYSSTSSATPGVVDSSRTKPA